MFRKKDNNEKKKTVKKEKPKADMGKIATKVLAAILALIMIFALAGTLIYYLVSY